MPARRRSPAPVPRSVCGRSPSSLKVAGAQALRVQAPKASSAADARPEIVRRSYHFSLPADRILDWNVQGLHTTAWLNALSVFFPLGESFFIWSVKKFSHCVPAGSPLAEDVSRFVFQESVHSREHELYNAALARHYWVGAIEGLIWAVLGFFKCLSSSLCLAGTVGLEHLTAALGHTLVTDDAAFEGCEPHYAALWRWHAQEEVEHKAVAFDVFTAAFGTGLGAYVLRCVGFVLSNLILLIIVAPVYLYFVIRSGGLFDGQGWRSFLHAHFGGPAFPGGPPVGRIRRIRPLWRDFFRRDFHPWDHDDSQYLKLLTPPPK